MTEDRPRRSSALVLMSGEALFIVAVTNWWLVSGPHEYNALHRSGNYAVGVPRRMPKGISARMRYEEKDTWPQEKQGT